MKSIRYILLALLLVPGAALAQNAVLDVNGVEYGAFATQNFGAQFENQVPFGPFDIVIATDEEGDGTTFDGCDPITNPDEVAGNIALISRGTCAFVVKAQNAAAAGAVAYIVHMDDREGQEGETFVNMGGDCTIDGSPPDGGCSIPGAFINRVIYKSILPELKFGAVGTITPDFPQEPSVGVVETGGVNLPIYDDGFFGATAAFTQTTAGGEAPFTFNGFNPLFVGTVLVGIDGNVVTNPYDGASEYVRNGTVVTGTIGENQPAAQASFASEDAGVTVTNLAFGETGNDPADPYVFMQLSVASTTGADINDAYIGLFADWDVVDDADDASTNDSGGFNGDLGLAYVFDADMTQYYGVMPYGVETTYPGTSFSGYTTDAAGADEDLFTALSTPVPPADGEAERAVVVGQGPYTLPGDGTPVVQAFILVAGTSEAELFANAAEALDFFAVAAEEETVAGTYRLESAYPNPFAQSTTIGFSLPTTEEVNLTVYDMLGREVATLASGVRQAGSHSVEFDATALPSGVYVYRLTAGQTSLTERLTVVR